MKEPGALFAGAPGSLLHPLPPRVEEVYDLIL